MNRYEFPLESDSPQLAVQAQGDVTILGQDAPGLVVECLGPRPALEQEGGKATLTCSQDCRIRLPAATQLTLRAAGDATIRQVAGPIRVESVAEDLTLAEVGPVTVRECQGDLVARDVAGRLSANVGGDAKVIGAAQGVRLNVGGDAQVQAAAGDLSINAGADVLVAELQATPGLQAKVNARGDAICRLEGVPGIQAKVACGGELTVENEGETTRHGLGAHRLQGGSQTLILAVAAGGDVQLRGLALADLEIQSLSQSLEGLAELGELGGKLGKVGASLGAVGARLGALLGQNLARKLGSLAQGMEIEVGEEEERWVKGTWSASFHRGPAGAPAADTPEDSSTADSSPAEAPADPGDTVERPGDEPVSDQERMVILRMVSEGKISAEEGEQLLAALENFEEHE